jgi:hypothetical protein
VPFPAGKKKIDIGDFYGKYSKIQAALGWRPKTTLREGLRTTIDYYRKNIKSYLPGASAGAKGASSKGASAEGTSADGAGAEGTSAEGAWAGEGER